MTDWTRFFCSLYAAVSARSQNERESESDQRKRQKAREIARDMRRLIEVYKVNYVHVYMRTGSACMCMHAYSYIYMLF